ncbi:hypothetical protein AAJ72_14900 [Citromicrobium sp. RCC1885]|uniref:DUF2254 domain-containing protein n=1 Tax=unclassified Citromicrobium TaxID=2630544 RepID=UPI0006C91CAC|nr:MULTISPECIES: DUF2254 domain-containing protein [unclassified Citromicrobium]MAY78794.1 DUF2254 domain-containing protein [Citromicrobium sp.]KPM15920.1 hypothetical protein WG75_07725 [Citromicrobium sp. WPS32]KPM21624.1 hypothetical protein AAJ72_14900 [Citromicrobium sp. RCC1885]KPM23451.1 hypothetical protein AAJ74_15265 [Citromicrobium sp. RCC1878]OAM07014.1 hypothetical protein A0U43_13990 [Citromicrobium sp. RCC1897]|tara:strand:+ start:6270 stop:7586 length:1317 start_codon:yes stop_codon:yes gene_type:complete
MIARLQKLWSDINASYWFFPGLFAISTLLLAMLTVELDRRGLTEWVDHLNWLPPARPQGASNMLTVIASSMIGVASTVFSITIAAVAYASGNYGPRLLTNFMEDRGNQLSLATFIGTFVYAITVLLSVRMPDESGVLTSQGDGFVPQLSLLIAYVLMAVSVMVLVYFLNHVPSSIRINAVLEGIGRRLLNAIRDNFDEPMKARVEGEVREGTPVFASRTGYIQVINWNELLKVARKSGSELQLAVRTGDFCHPSVAIGYWSEKPDDACDEQVRECIALGDARTPAQDLHFMIDELVEIGLRALSPGINDPFTAISALHWIGAATAELGKRDLNWSVGEPDEDGRRPLRPMADDFSHYLGRGFGTIRSAAATSPPAAAVMFDSLESAAVTITDPVRHKNIRDEADQLMRQAKASLTGPDLEQVEARFALFRKRLEDHPK